MELTENARRKLARRNVACLATSRRDGSPHVAPVWVDVDGDDVLVVTWAGSLKDRNVRRDPRVALTVFEWSDPYDKVDIRGRVVEIIEGELAEQRLHELSRKYTGKPYELAPEDQLVLLRIEPERLYEEAFPDLARRSLEQAALELAPFPTGIRHAALDLLSALSGSDADSTALLARLLANVRSESDLEWVVERLSR